MPSINFKNLILLTVLGAFLFCPLALGAQGPKTAKLNEPDKEKRFTCDEKLWPSEPRRPNGPRRI